MQRYTLITGATSGIGYELAHLCAKDGRNLVLVARNRKRLEQIQQSWSGRYGIRIIIIEADLSNRRAPKHIYNYLNNKNVWIDTLINNAGVGSFGYFHEVGVNNDLQIVDINMRMLTHLCKLFVPNMIRQGQGRILNVASTAAFAPGPMMSVYYASKAYVLSLSCALANELKGSGITVSVLCPGPTKTDFQARSKMKKSALAQKTAMDARTVAKAGYRGMIKGKEIIVPGISNQLVVQMMGLLPYRLKASVVRITQKEK